MVGLKKSPTNVTEPPLPPNTKNVKKKKKSSLCVLALQSRFCITFFFQWNECGNLILKGKCGHKGHFETCCR